MQSISSLNTLPFEIIEKITTKKDMKSAIQVNLNWHETIFKYMKNGDYQILNEFTKLICNNLDKAAYGGQITRILEIGTNAKILNSLSLGNLRLSFVESRDKMVDILLDLNKNDLKNVGKALYSNEEDGKIKIPDFFQAVFDCARICSDVNKLEMGDVRRPGKLKDYALKLSMKGYTEKAIEVVKTISDQKLQAETLKYISKHLIEVGENYNRIGRIYKAFEVAVTIPKFEYNDARYHECHKTSALESCFFSFLKLGDVDMAISAIDEIPDIDLKVKLYKNLFDDVDYPNAKLILGKIADLHYTKEKHKIRFIEQNEYLLKKKLDSYVNRQESLSSVIKK